MIYTVKGFSVISETEVDFLWGGGHLCFLHDSVNAGNLISTLTVIKEQLLFRCEGFREVISIMPDVQIPEREERRFPRQCNSQKKGSLLLTRVRAPAAHPTQWYGVREH